MSRHLGVLPLIGTVLDKYEVLQKVGEGGMATVYLGRHTTLDRDVAIKVLHPHLSSSTRNRKRFAREARAIEHLRHRNILEIYDYSGTDCSECYIVTEFVEGDTLSQLMARVGRLPSEVATLVGIHLADALAYAHEAGVLHRDLKPDNVMVRADGTVKLMDFGIARFLDESQVTMTGALVGSPLFMSPEQAREGDLDARSDLFSLGTLLYHLVTGHMPFKGSNPSLILKNIIEGNRPHVTELAPSTSAALADVIERCMQLDREERYPSAVHVSDALRDCLREVGFDPHEKRWKLSSYLEDSGVYTDRLELWLGDTLLARGRAQLAAGDPLAALRLFNRLLTLDEDNPEVLELVSGLHAEQTAALPRSRYVATLLAVGVAVVAGLGTWWVVRQMGEDEVVESPVPTAMVHVPDPPDPEPVAMAAPDPERVLPEPEPGPAPVARVAPRPLTLPPTIRVPALSAPEPEPEQAGEPGRVEIRSHVPLMAEVYDEGGTRLGHIRQRGPIELTPGEHVLTLRGPGIKDYTLRLTVEAGEVSRRYVDDLSPRPVDVLIGRDYPATCEVYVNGGESLGTVEALQGKVALPDPLDENIVVLDCGEAGMHRQIFAQLTTEFPVFTGGTEPR